MMDRAPLDGIRVLEFAAIGPVPFAGMLLADMGAEVLRIDRPSGQAPVLTELGTIMQRGKQAVRIDLKQTEGVTLARALVERADVLIEGFRPGVMERLGLGPDECSRRNPRLLYGRMTGWGQYGPLAPIAGHDINYIALSGVLSLIGRRGSPPTVPLNLIGDYGGAVLLAFGIVCGLFERAVSAKGQVIDAAMFEGSAVLATAFFGARAAGRLSSERGTNSLDTGAPWYDVYETSDGKYVAVGAIEQEFFDEMCDLVGIERADAFERADPARWPAIRARLAAAFRKRTRDEWTRIVEGTDACVTPVLDLDEAAEHAHARIRGAFVELDGVLQPAPTPRFSRSAPRAPRTGPSPNSRSDKLDLSIWGVARCDLDSLRARGIVG